jgi:ABC-type Fe3+ transport system permease subunit/sugar lactone lactonase YvrE
MNWLLLQNSLLVSALATAGAVGAGFAAAICLAGLTRPWRLVVLGASALVLALPPFLVTNTWLHYAGFAGTWKGWFPGIVYSLGGAAWVLALMLWPITLLAVWGAWQRLEPAHLESDPALTGWPLMHVLLLPLARAALGQAALITFVLALANFSVPAILQVKVLPAEMWIRFNTTFDTRGALLMSLPLLIAPLLLILWFSRQQVSWPRIAGPVSPSFFRTQLGHGWFYFSGATCLVLLALSAGLPLIQVFTSADTWKALPGAIAAGKSALGQSILVAAMAAGLVVALTFLALPVNSRISRWRSVAGTGLWMLFFTPGVLIGMGLIFGFNRPLTSAFYQSAGVLILALVIKYLAIGWHVSMHSARTLDRNLVEAAQMEGAGRGAVLRQAVLPQVSHSLMAAAYLVFLLCLWDVETIVLVVPPGGDTLALRIFNLLHYGYSPEVNALCVVLLGVALLPLGIWALTTRAARRRPCASSGFSIHLVPSALSLAVVLALFLVSCSSHDSPGAAGLQSRIFDGVQVFSKRGVGVGELNKPRSVTVDTNDSYYVVDMTGRVQKFSSNGVFQLSWQMPESDKGRPKGLCRDQDGLIVVNEPHYSRVNYFTPAGVLAAQFGQHGTNAGQLAFPRAVTVNSRGEIYVSEYGLTERVQQFSAHGKSVLNGFGHMGDGPGEFNRPEGLCLDKQDRLYVADSCNHRIQIFDAQGKFLRSYGKAGRAVGELSYPYDIVVDAEGRQYVCEFGNSRIQVFDAGDHPIEIIGGPGAEPGRFANPWGVALDSRGNLYVADSQNHRVQKLMRK